MRDFKGMKRQRGRNRGGGNSGGGQKPTHNVNRAFDSNGPDGVKIRGAAQHVFEKYQQLARDASSSGDRVLGENYLQHAEHYFRLIRAVQPTKPASEIIGRDTFSGYDIDFEDESGQIQQEAADNQEAAAEPAEATAEPPRSEYRSENRDRDNNGNNNRQDGQQREPRQEWRRDRDNRDRDNNRQDGYRQDANRQDGNRQDANRSDGNRPDGNRQEARRDDRPPREDRSSRNRDRDRDRDRPERSEPAVVAEVETPVTAPIAAAPADDFQFRSHDGDLSPAPAFLQARPEPRSEAGVDGEAAAEPKRARAPRRRRAPRGFEEGGEGGSAAPETEDA